MSDTPTPSSSDSYTPAATSAKPTVAEGRGPIRNGIESIGMAVLMAVLLKYFVLEAYVIPTPSMQPTMMGSPAEGESDRILVDKFYYLIHEPKRWDIAVFRYPVRQVQSYVKRIVGVGGDRIRIVSGDLYNVAKDGKSLKILRKPDSIQATLWREIYPMRQDLERFDSSEDVSVPPKTGDVFPAIFRGRGGNWEVDSTDGAFVASPKGKTLQLIFRDPARNNYVDGYDLGVASLLRKARPDNAGVEEVQDLAIETILTPTNAPESFVAALDIAALNIELQLEVKAGKARLTASRKVPAVKVESPEFDFAIPAGTATSIRFEHRDDRLLAFHDGELVQSLDIDDLPILDDLKPGSISPRFTVTGAGQCRFADVRVERDLHYTLGGSIAPNEIIEVPEGHFFMMGDNTRGSADGRQWTAVQIGVDKDNNIVRPDSDKAVRKLWGNERPKPMFNASDVGHDDDNPVPMLSEDKVVFVDEVGEIHALNGKIDPKRWALPAKPDDASIQFLGDEPWSPPSKPARFVPREHIQGRPVARFLRSLSGFKFTAWIR